MRNRVIHGYWSIDLEILHTTSTDLLPAFTAQLTAVLASLEADGEMIDTRSRRAGGPQRDHPPEPWWA